MATISSPGIGSGLDVKGLISELMAIERQPLDKLQLEQQQYSAQISAYGQLIGSVSSFESVMNSMGTLSALDIYSTSSSNKDIINITATDNPDQGSFDVEVIRLAEYHKMTSAEKAATDTFGGTAGDEFSIQIGSAPEDTITVDLSTAQTLEQIRDAINADENNPGVHAAIISGDGGVQKLVLTSEETGSVNALTLTYGGSIDSDTLGLQTSNDIGGDIGLLDAQFVVDGLTITRSSNTISDVISGVTFTLEGEDPGTVYRISVNKDVAAIQGLVQSFADAYNALQTAMDDLRAGDLGTDSTLRIIENQLTGTLNTAAQGDTFSVLSEVGLRLQKDGTMELDSAVLESALEQDADAVAVLFAADGDGFANRLSSLADSWIANDGLIESRTDGINASINRLVDKQYSIERKLGIVEERYWKQFTSLDVLLSQMQATSTYLTQQLSALPGFTYNSQQS